MKNIVIAALTIILVVSLGFNCKQYKQSQEIKDIMPISNYQLDKIEKGSIMLDKVFMLYNDDRIISIAEYEPATPANWHKHSAEQVIYVSEGEGYYQEENQPVRLIKEGDIIITKPNIKSWHGSTPDKKLRLIVITPNIEDPITLLEPVSDEEYNNIKLKKEV